MYLNIKKKSIKILAIISLSFFVFPFFSLALTQSEVQIQKEQLENELKQLENEIKQKEIELVGQKGQSKSISNDINIISKKIEKAKLDIKAKNIVITKLWSYFKIS